MLKFAMDLSAWAVLETINLLARIVPLDLNDLDKDWWDEDDEDTI